MANSSVSSGLASSSQLSSTALSLDAKLERLIELKKLVKAADEEMQIISDDLDRMVEEGQAEEQMVWNDYKITRRTRKSYSYPQHILQQREELKASERLSVALGEATLKTTTYYTVSEAR